MNCRTFSQNPRTRGKSHQHHHHWLYPERQEESKVSVVFKGAGPCQGSLSATAIFHDMTNSIVEISEVGVVLPEWRVILHLYV